MSNNEKKIKRPVNGILLLDKPTGVSSNGALQQVKRLFMATKAGHTGSLDPLATGMLPVCLGEATKFSQYLLHADKVYRVKGRLGSRTTTGDAEGEVIETRNVPTLTPAQLETVLTSFRGTISQIPSMFSALKYRGQPLYKLARQGIEVPRTPRQIKIYSLELCQFDTDQLELQVRCSSGTYVRTLIEDIGATIGCGAYVTELRRVLIDPYQATQMLTLSELEQHLQLGNVSALDQLLLPIDSVFTHYPDLHLEKNSAFFFMRGNSVVVPHAPLNGMVRLYHKDGPFIGIGEIDSSGKVAPLRLVRQ